MKNILIILLSVIVFGCDPDPKETLKTVNLGGVEFYVVNMEGCDYLWRSNGNGTHNIIHKGNCSNPVHQGLEKSDEKKNEPIYLEPGKVTSLKIPEGHTFSIKYEGNDIITVEAVKK